MKKIIIAMALAVAMTATQVSAENKYNEMGYVNVSGKTIADIVTEQGITLEQFLAEYDLPADMPADTTEAAAYYSIPLSKMAEMYAMDVEALKETLQLGEEITAETPWGIAEGEASLGAYVGEENVDAFKAQYGFGDEVTAQTKWKEVRNVVDEAQKAVSVPEITLQDDTDAKRAYVQNYNKYNEMDAVNVTNMTLQDVADSSMVELDALKEAMGLPADMPGDTNQAIAMGYIPMGQLAKDVGVSFEEFAKEIKPVKNIEITDKTLYRDYENNLSVGDYFGDGAEEAIAEVGLGESVTVETPYSDVRNQMERKMLALYNQLGYFTGEEILVMVNGKYLDFDVAPVIMNDRVLVPMRAIFEALGANVSWMGETQTIFAIRGKDIITMQIGQDSLFKNEEKIQLDTPSIATDGRTLVPIRAVAEALDTQVFYNANTKTVVIH